MTAVPNYRPQAVELVVDTPDVRVAEITLSPGADTPPHEHTDVEEICYCLAGELTCEAEGEPAAVLRTGEKKRFAAGTDHRLSNQGGQACRFLLVHGVGRFNFVRTACLRRQPPAKRRWVSSRANERGR